MRWIRLRKAKIIAHASISLIIIFLIAVLPIIINFNLFGTENKADAESGASLRLPDQPSGDFIILMNAEMHGETADDWKKFFLTKDDGEFDVIFDDIRCIAAEGDTAGIRTAERFKAQLPENQMRLRTEEPALLVSKAEACRIDTAIFSREMAEALKLSSKESLENKGVIVIEVSGEEQYAQT